MIGEIRRLWAAVGNSLRGWRHLLAREWNTRYLLLAFALVFALHALDLLDRTETAILAVALAATLGIEILNTAIEELLDLLRPEHCEQVGRVKDMLSAAVLAGLAVCALLLGRFLLGP